MRRAINQMNLLVWVGLLLWFSIRLAAIDSPLPAGVPFIAMAVACTSGRAHSAGSTSRHDKGWFVRTRRHCVYLGTADPGSVGAVAQGYRWFASKGARE